MLTGPWYVTATAIRDYAAILRLPPVTGGPVYERLSRELQEMASETVASGRIPTETDSGALRYRGPKPSRLQLIVMPSTVAGKAPQLVRVLPSHKKA